MPCFSCVLNPRTTFLRIFMASASANISSLLCKYIGNDNDKHIGSKILENVSMSYDTHQKHLFS
jgi:hypothetical protein